MLHRESAPFDSPNPLVDTLRDSLNEIHKIKSRLTDLQEQLSDVLMQIQTNQPALPSIDIDSKLAPRIVNPSITESATDSLYPAPIASSCGTACEPLPEHSAGTENRSDAQVADSIELRKWLLDRGISIRQLGAESPFEESFDRIALQLGRDFEHLADFYQALKRSIGGNGVSKSIVLKNYPADRINRVVQFGDELLRNGFLKEFRYIRNSRSIQFAPQADGRVGNFITGNWLERYVVITVSQHLRKLYPGRSIEVLSNPRIILPDGSDFEIDVLIACDSIVLWFECKTGKDYPAYLTKYAVVARKVMQLGSEHAAMILLEELNDSEKKNNTHVAGMSVLNLNDVQRFLSTIQSTTQVGSATVVGTTKHVLPVATRYVVPGPTALQVPALKMNFTQWLAVLNREQLRPLDVIVRRQIIEDLFDIGSSTAGDPIPLRCIVNSLAEKYIIEGRKVSKAMINDVSRALYRSGCCELGSHADFQNKVWLLRSDVSCVVAFAATASLYLWAGIKARESFQPESLEAIELSRVIWGGQLSNDEANALVDRAVSDMQKMGRCIANRFDDRVIVNAVGERFWDDVATDPELSIDVSL